MKEENPVNHALPVRFRNPPIPQYEIISEHGWEVYEHLSV
jgi:hypothetical protein